MESVDAKRSRLLCLHEDCIDSMPLTRSTRCVCCALTHHLFAQGIACPGFATCMTLKNVLTRWELREYTNKLFEGVLDPTCAGFMLPVHVLSLLVRSDIFFLSLSNLKRWQKIESHLRITWIWSLASESVSPTGCQPCAIVLGGGGYPY
jgi:hypothetical protein